MSPSANRPISLFFSLYPNVTGIGGGKRNLWWLPLLLVFSRAEMVAFTKSLGAERKFFRFGFDTPARVLQTLPRTKRDFTKFTLATDGIVKLRKHLGAG
ncbi:MAG TPA: hypothetical protein VIU85_08585 [Chthoniobacterales bacterium]